MIRSKLCACCKTQPAVEGSPYCSERCEALRRAAFHKYNEKRKGSRIKPLPKPRCPTCRKRIGVDFDCGCP